MLKPQDVVVAVKLAVAEQRDWTYEQLASTLRLSSATVHRSIQRARDARLVPRAFVTDKTALLEILTGGGRYVYYPITGPVTRGMPTAHGRPTMSAATAAQRDVPVWPDPEGPARGVALLPLHECVPHAARDDDQLYTVLSLFDALRSGRARERSAASKALFDVLAP
jgi:hypothetical protein